jgi:hypothetical protein
MGELRRRFQTAPDSASLGGRASLGDPALKQTALARQRDDLVAAGAGTQMGAQFLMSRAEAGRPREGAEPAPGRVALLDRSMVLFNHGVRY